MSTPGNRPVVPLEGEPPSEAQVFGSRIVLATAGWLIIGIIALGNKTLQTALITEIIVAVCTTIQPFLILNLFMRMNQHWPGRGFNYFIAGAVGVAITTACTLALSATTDVGTIFWILSGNYIGWALEHTTQGIAILLLWTLRPEAGDRVMHVPSSEYELVGHGTVDLEAFLSKGLHGRRQEGLAKQHG